MKQLTQKLKDGKMQVKDVAVPSRQNGMVLVKNHYSLISTGIEGSNVKTTRKGYIGKSKERPQQVKQVIDTLKTQGIVQTYRAVMKKLDAYSPYFLDPINFAALSSVKRAKSLPKERVEIFSSGSTSILDDFRTLSIHARGKKKKKKLLSQDKGQKAEVKQFVEAMLNGTGAPISFEEIYSASLITFKVVESIRTGECIRI